MSLWQMHVWVWLASEVMGEPSSPRFLLWIYFLVSNHFVDVDVDWFCLLKGKKRKDHTKESTDVRGQWGHIILQRVLCRSLCLCTTKLRIYVVCSSISKVLISWISSSYFADGNIYLFFLLTSVLVPQGSEFSWHVNHLDSSLSVGISAHIRPGTWELSYLTISILLWINTSILCVCCSGSIMVILRSYSNLQRCIPLQG